MMFEFQFDARQKASNKNRIGTKTDMHATLFGIFQEILLLHRGHYVLCSVKPSFRTFCFTLLATGGVLKPRKF